MDTSRSLWVAAGRCGGSSRPPRHRTPQNPIEKPLQSVGKRWKASLLQLPGRGSTPLPTRRPPGVASRRRGGEADSEWFWEGWGWFCELPTAPSCDSRPRYTCECDLSLRKPLEDVLFIIQDHCAAIAGPQTLSFAANPVTRQNVQGFAPERDPLPKPGFGLPAIGNMSQLIHQNVILACAFSFFHIVGLGGTPKIRS